MRKRNVYDGRSKTKLYKSWVAMKRRCDDPDDLHKKYYENIHVCNEWYDFDVFKKWAIENGYVEGYTIERLDNSKGYCPDNCTWIPKEKQNINKRNKHLIKINGVEKTINEWCKEYNIKWTTFYARIQYGYKDDELLFGRRR